MTFIQRLFFFMVCMGVLNCSTNAWATEPAEKMKWNFQNIEVKALLQSLAEIGKQNLIVAEGVAGQVSLHLNDMTWREALEVVVTSRGLVVTPKEGVLWITSRNVSAENLQTVAVALKYAKAADVAQRLQAASAGSAGAPRWMSPRGLVMAEPRTNQVL